MPKQSRGFWVCSLCSQAFDQFEDASYHESENCPLRYSSHPAGDPSSWQQFPIQPEPYVMPPSSNVNVATPTGHRREPSSASFSFDIKPEPRLALLLGPNDSCALETTDAIACKSIELFETNEFSESGRLLTQVGLRCSFCSSPSSEIFPRSINHVGECVRQITEQHLFGCRSFPQESRDLIKRSVKKQQQIKKGGDPIDSDEKKSLSLLTEFCVVRCKKLGVIDRTPKNSGIMLDTVLGSASHGQMIPRAAPLSPSVHRRSSPLQDESFRSTQLHGDRAMAPYHHSPYHQTIHFDTANEQLPLSSYHAYVPGYVVPPDFPFVQERGGEWVCKFCNHLHPAMRDPKCYWMAPDRSPPPHDFIDYHLSACRAFQESQYNAFEYQGSFSGQPVNVYSSTRWETPFEDDQQMLATGVDPRIPYDSIHSELSQFEGSPYNRLPPPTSNAYPAESPQSRRYGTPVAHTSRPEPPESNEEYGRALEFLAAADREAGGQNQSESSLVVGEDKLLLTDYFYYIMKQLCPVRFSEADRRTRGGKRENIAVGYGGLQCIHCADLPNTRKFFWSNVDRLANSFAEIPSHVLKCRRCPQPTKDALLLLKQRHPDQMSRLPRGSQKVFFRRMWRRLHDEDPPQDEDAISPVVPSTSPPPETRSSSFSTVKTNRPNPVETGLSLVDNSPAGTSGSEESIIMLQRSTVEAAKALADAAIQAGPPSPFSRVLLAVPEDQKWLSDTDCFIRRQLEVFCSTREDVENARNDRKYPVREGQVGIRCIHCALSKNGARGQAVAYPFNISGIYEAAREFQRLHLESCENLPPAAKGKLEKLKGSASLSSVLRKYYILAANAIGLVDTRDGIRAGGESIPIGSQAAFAFSEESSPRQLDDSLTKGDPVSQRGALFERERMTRKRTFEDEESSGEAKPPARSKEKHGV